MKTKVSLALAAIVLILALTAAFIPASAEDVIITTVTKVENTLNDGRWYTIDITFDEMIANGPVNEKSNAAINDYVMINGKTLTELNAAYPNLIESNYIACGDTTTFYFMHINIDTSVITDGQMELPSTTAANTVKVLKGLTAPSGCKVGATQKFVTGPATAYSAIGAFTEQAAANVTGVACTTDSDTFYTVEITFDQKLNATPLNPVDKAYINDYIKVNGKTLTEIRTQYEGLLDSNYIACGDESTQYKMQLNFAKSAFPSDFSIGTITDKFEILSGLCMENGAETFSSVRYDRTTSTDFVLYEEPDPVSSDVSSEDEEPTVSDEDSTDTDSSDATDSSAESDDSPKTGDNGVMGIVLVGIVASGAAVAVKSRKK